MIDAHASPPATRTPAFASRNLAGAAAVIVLCGAGCVRRIDTEYGAVRGDSLNGVSAFVQLLRDSGHATTARQRLPATITPDCRTLVIFDDSFVQLDPETATTIEDLLDADGEHTVLLVLRDSDAAVGYLRSVLAAALAADVRGEARRQLDQREADLAAATAEAREATSPFPDALIPVSRRTADGPIEVRARTADGATTRITATWELHRQLEPGPTTRVIWGAGREPLLVRRERGGSELLVLASASPVLNGSLVDPGNRALAEELAALLPVEGRLLLAGSPRRGSGDEGDDEGAESSWRLLTVQPLPWVAIHALAALGLFCWWRSPIFGRPRREDPGGAQDFGHHIDALAGLIADGPAAGTDFSTARLSQWAKEPPRTPSGDRARRT